MHAYIALFIQSKSVCLKNFADTQTSTYAHKKKKKTMAKNLINNFLYTLEKSLVYTVNGKCSHSLSVSLQKKNC